MQEVHGVYCHKYKHKQHHATAPRDSTTTCQHRPSATHTTLNCLMETAPAPERSEHDPRC
ncbi:hypothetical protein E2C01_001732 [Portunus trituberculatus]|uniref:Uncharacterized protein n=1 Tax=Portunus trituberculatus TaxID=210409 RepID=A0A5B7CID2_PORTR|nr:hypothetical protein [Portunus trituberculatus]